MPINPRRLLVHRCRRRPEYARLLANRMFNATIAERHLRFKQRAPPPSKRAVKCRCTDPSLEIAGSLEHARVAQGRVNSCQMHGANAWPRTSRNLFATPLVFG